MEIVDLLREVAPEGLAVYSGRLQNLADGFHFEVELDGLNDPRGAVSLSECERYSQRLIERLDHELVSDGEWRQTLPSGLTVDNYSVEVASAGAERELRLPGELERFRGQPLYIRFAEEGEPMQDAVVVFIETQRDAAEQTLVFQRYQPTARRARRKQRKARSGGSAEAAPLRISPAALRYARLYLDF